MAGRTVTVKISRDDTEWLTEVTQGARHDERIKCIEYMERMALFGEPRIRDIINAIKKRDVLEALSSTTKGPP